MCAFAAWLHTNWLTITSIILSGLISLWISAAYYRKGNRNNLQMSVIFPIISLLEDNYSRSNYQLLSDLSKNYCIRYMKREEQKTLAQLLLSYKEISPYDSNSANADILRSYFEYTLRQNEVNPKPVPFDYEGETVFYDYPPDMNYLTHDLERAMKSNILEIEQDKCQDAIVYIFNHYCKDCYGLEKPLGFFKDYSLLEVLTKSEIKKKWDEHFEKMEQSKQSFLNMRIAKELISK